ncbi:exocyst subunit exo70 family protein D1 [Abeliophyllum distichum]|uniref:Exocyst subunit exo70 family protein D1 n=1 Tax=Abeliophyllum distichum TaxID=126358 RepID=A0ABD1VP82_9LAMI
MEPPGENDAAAAAATFNSAEKIILRWDSTVSEDARDKMIFEGDRHEIDRYLHAVEEIQKSMESTTVSESSSSALQIAMARLEDEFRNILLSHTSPVETGVLN